MPAADLPAHEWLPLGRASRVVGVDPDTLRRWADEGRVEAYLTPGGHRRFERAALDRLTAARRSAGRPGALLSRLGATPERLSRAYRRSYPHNPASLGPLAGEDRRAFREQGRRLVEALVAYLDAADPAERRRAEALAARMTDELAQRVAATGAGLTAAVSQFVAARRPLLAEIGHLAARRATDPATLSGLYQAASDMLDQLLLRVLASYGAGAADARAIAADTASAAGPTAARTRP